MSARYPRERSTDKEILVTKPYKTSPDTAPAQFTNNTHPMAATQRDTIQLPSMRDSVQWEADFKEVSSRELGSDGRKGHRSRCMGDTIQ